MNGIEEKFYKCFGIKYKLYYDCNLADTIDPQEVFPLKNCSKGEIISYCKDRENYRYCKVTKVNKFYPPITDRVLLELICIYSGLPDVEYQKHFLDVDNMKKYTLSVLIDNVNTSGGYYKRQVRKLFEEGEE